MNNKLKTLLGYFDLSELVIFERQILKSRKVKIEHLYSALLFSREAKKLDFDKFKKDNLLTKGQNWRSEYTKALKKRILDEDNQ